MIDKDDSTDKWECPFCGSIGAVIIEESVLKDDWKEILCGCTKCDEMYIRKYKYVKTVKLVRTQK